MDHVCLCLNVSDEDRNRFELGYYKPGHGNKGKKLDLVDSDDLENMKELYKGKKEVLLWCYDPAIQVVGKKRCRVGRDTGNPGPPAPKSKSRSRFENAYEEKMSKVEEIYESLREKHGSKFKAEQFRVWANMIQLDKHSSLETPPAGRFFKSPAEKRSECVTSVTATATKEATVATYSSAEPAALSPAKRVTLRTQCIEQLER